MEQSEKKITTQESTVSKSDGKNNQSRIYNTFTSFLLSKKLWMTVFALIVLWIVYFAQINYLYSFANYPNEMAALLIPSFISLTKDFMLAFTAVVLGFVGVEGVVSWRHGTESVVNQATSFINEKREETQHIIDESVPNRNLREFQE